MICFLRNKVIIRQQKQQQRFIRSLSSSSWVTNRFPSDKSSKFLEMFPLRFLRLFIKEQSQLWPGVLWYCKLYQLSLLPPIKYNIQAGEKGSAHLFWSLQVVMVNSCLTVENPPVHRSFVVVDTSLFWVWWW